MTATEEILYHFCSHLAVLLLQCCSLAVAAVTLTYCYCSLSEVLRTGSKFKYATTVEQRHFNAFKGNATQNVYRSSVLKMHSVYS